MTAGPVRIKPAFLACQAVICYLCVAARRFGRLSSGLLAGALSRAAISLHSTASAGRIADHVAAQSNTGPDEARRGYPPRSCG
ncbi:MAG: hypothetical protein KDK08_29035, partial [Rhizobiaceae bacterium]|nr:hypothetical protein [Rhizobiaceae bacterium]